jgi:two-component system sensor histidine kinase/response regulator
MTPPRPAPSPTGPLRVLVAEDNRLNSLLIAEQLHVLELEPEVVSNGRIALERWRGGAFAAVLTDINMPDMDGYELAMAIRGEEHAGVRIPIIALTANAFIDKSDRWRAAGIDDWLIKPLDLSALKNVMDRWLLQDSDPEPVAQRAIAAGSDPIDPTALPRFVGDDPAVLADFMAKFAQSAEQAGARLEVAMAAANGRVEARSLAHQLKASAAAVGAGPLAQLCADIESAALAEDDVALASAWRQLPPEIRRVTDWISAHGCAERQ